MSDVTQLHPVNKEVQVLINGVHCTVKKHIFLCMTFLQEYYPFLNSLVALCCCAQSLFTHSYNDFSVFTVNCSMLDSLKPLDFQTEHIAPILGSHSSCLLLITVSFIIFFLNFQSSLQPLHPKCLCDVYSSNVDLSV